MLTKIFLLHLKDTDYTKCHKERLKGGDKQRIGILGYHDGAADDGRFSTPKGCTFWGDFNLLIADYDNRAIRRIDTMLGDVHTVIKGGVGDGPFDARGDSEGGLLYTSIIETFNETHLILVDNLQNIRMIDLERNIITTIVAESRTEEVNTS